LWENGLDLLLDEKGQCKDVCKTILRLWTYDDNFNVLLNLYNSDITKSTYFSKLAPT